jgi:hypothetical protein
MTIYQVIQDEIGQVSRDTSSLQDITRPEITKEHEGGIEVQNEIAQVVVLGRFHLVPQFHLRILQ